MGETQCVSESELALRCAHQISRRDIDILLDPSSMNTPLPIYPLERSYCSLKRKRDAPNQLRIPAHHDVPELPPDFVLLVDNECNLWRCRDMPLPREPFCAT